MVTIKKIALLTFLSLPASQVVANPLPFNVNGWKLAAIVPACATLYYAAATHEACVLGRYLNYLKDKAPNAFNQIPYAEKNRQLMPVGRLLSALSAAGCATVAGLLYWIGNSRN